MRSPSLVALALLAVPFSLFSFAACDSADSASGSGDRARTGPPTGAESGPNLAVASDATIAIASPASGEVFVTNKDRVSLRGLASGKAGAITVETSAGAKVVAAGTSAWYADDVPVPLGKSRVTASVAAGGAATEAKDSLVVVRTQQLGFTAPATVFPDGVVVGKKTAAVVRVPLDTASTIDRATLAVYRKAGTKLTRVGTLHDDGKNGDERASDGVFSTTVLLDEPTVGRTAFHVGGTGPGGEENALAFFVDVVEPIDPADLKAGHDLLGELQAIFDKTGDVNKVLDKVRSSPRVKEHAVTAVGGDFSLSLRLVGDIPAQWNKPLPSGYRGNAGSVVGNTKAFVAAPYLDQFSPADEGPAVQTAFATTTCPAWDKGTGALLTNDSVDISVLRTLPDYGAIHLSSHGGTWAAMRRIGTQGEGCDLDAEKCTQGFNWYDGPGTEVILYTRESVTDAPSADRVQTQDYSAEMRQGRIGINYGSYFVTPKFFAGLPKRFPNSAVMFSICRGAFNGTMGDAFVRKGAATYLGFSEIVASGFADPVSRSIWGCLLDNQANEGQGKSVDECLPATKCDASPVTVPNATQCQLTNGVITCVQAEKVQYANSCLKTFGDTSVKLPHTDAKGQSCVGAVNELCGDGKRSGSELCEGMDVGGATCASIFGAGYRGIVSCSSSCQLVTDTCAVCNGDGKKDGMEQCDGADLGGFVCPNGGTASCGSNCVLDTSACAPAPAACNHDNVRDADEACDGTDLSYTCEQYGYPGGTLTCTDCQLDASACTPVSCVGGAPDGKLEAPEKCDGTSFGGATCASILGDPRQAGVLSCRNDCTIDATACALSCNPDGNRTPDEACDGQDFGGATCASLTGNPASKGVLACNGDCSIDTSGCGACDGDGKKSGTEECEGSDVGGATCASIIGSSYATGNVTCRDNCTLNKDQCSAPKQCDSSSCTVISPSGNGGPVSLPPFKPACDSCTTQVCATDAHCCATEWDYPCYIAAKEKCGCK